MGNPEPIGVEGVLIFQGKWEKAASVLGYSVSSGCRGLKDVKFRNEPTKGQGRAACHRHIQIRLITS